MKTWISRGRVLLSMFIIMTFVGCGFEVVPPAHKGKILSPSGYQDEIIEPSKVMTWPRESMVLIETSTNRYKESMTVILADKMRLAFDVLVRVRVGGDDKVINSMFNDITLENIDAHKMISTKKVYETYGQMLVRNISRSIVSKYTVEDIATNYEKVSSELFEQLSVKFKNIPLDLSEVAIGNIDFPKVVTEAVEKSKAREMEIQEEKAKVQIALEHKKGEEQVAEANYRLRMLVAKAIRDENKLISEGVSDKYLAYRALEIQEKMAENNATVFMPFEALRSVGAQTRMFSEKK